MGKNAVAYFATAYATHRTGFAGGEGREVIVEEEAFAALVENVIEDFLVELGSEGYGCERLGLATGNTADP